MAQEFTINSSTIEQKINQLLPSQGGMGAGIDFSASTMVIPIVDITESASGSALREDLQTAVDFATTRTTVNDATNVDIVTTTGFYKVDVSIRGNQGDGNLLINDGTSDQTIKTYNFDTTTSNIIDSFVIFLRAGDSFRGSSSATGVLLQIFTRQIADITGTITSPLGFNT